MQQNKTALQTLITFGPTKFQECLSEERKKKFPFLHNNKAKKLSSYHKNIIEDHQAKKNQQETIMITKSSESYIKHQTQFKKVSLNEENQYLQTQENKNIDSNHLRSNRIVLPSVFNMKNFVARASSNKKRSISSQSGSRNRIQDRRPTLQSNYRYKMQYLMDEGPQSALLRKYEHNEANEEAITPKQKINHFVNKKIHKKNSCAVNINGIDTKVLEGIINMKKIYN